MNTLVSFTSEQANRASEIILNLMKQRRFFLANEHTLDPNLFSECIGFDQSLRNFYKFQTALAEGYILQREEELGIIPPTLKEGQKIAKLSFYKGGLEIIGVYPVGKFTQFIPDGYDVLYSEIFQLCHGDKEDIPPRQLHGMETSTKYLTHRLWEELQEIKYAENSIVMVTETQFQPDKPWGFSTLKEKVGDLVSSPYGLTYLFHKNEFVDRVLKHDYALFDLDVENHPRVAHWNDGKDPVLTFGRSGGYDCRVKFVCVM